MIQSSHQILQNHFQTQSDGWNQPPVRIGCPTRAASSNGCATWGISKSMNLTEWPGK